MLYISKISDMYQTLKISDIYREYHKCHSDRIYIKISVGFDIFICTIHLSFKLHAFTFEPARLGSKTSSRAEPSRARASARLDFFWLGSKPPSRAEPDQSSARLGSIGALLKTLPALNIL